MKKEIRISDYLIQKLVKAKIKHVFLLPGGGNMFLIDAIAKSKKIFGVPCHHEQSAAIAAEAYGRIQNNIGVAVVTSGPGSTNAITGLLGAWIESVPLIIISGQIKTTDINKKIDLRQHGVQSVNIEKIVKSITKFSITLSKKDNFEKVFDKALNICKTGRPGPVWIDVPLDIQAKKIKNKLSSKKISSIFSKKTFNETKIKYLISKSKRPIFLIGHGLRLSNSTNKFINTLKKLPFPTVFTWNAMDTLPFNHKLNFGRPGVVAQRYSNFVVQNSDLVISVGCRIDSIITAFNEKNFAPFAKKIIVDIDNKELKKFNFKIDMRLNMDAKNFIAKLNKINFKTSNELIKWTEKCQYWKKNYSFEKEKQIKKYNKIDHYMLTSMLSDKIPENTIICTGSSGLGIEVFYSVFKNKKKQRIFLTSGLGSMGYGLPAAIGSCFANNKKPMILIEGDGSFQLNIQELAVLKKFNLPITIIIINNQGYCSIRNTQKNYFNKRFLGTGPNSNLGFPNLEKISKAYGINYMKITTLSDFKKKIPNNIKLENKPKIIEVNVEPNEMLRPKVSAIPQKNGHIISMPLEDMSPLLPIELLKKEMIIPVSNASIKSRQIFKKK